MTESLKQFVRISGELNRAMASHNLNDMSSRSHAMLSIQIEQDVQGYEDPQEQMTRQGKLIFVDLAGENNRSFPLRFPSISVFLLQGSEKVKASHSKGKQLVETNNINKSLLTLGKIILAYDRESDRLVSRNVHFCIE